jgi:hypothetical protein
MSRPANTYRGARRLHESQSIAAWRLREDPEKYRLFYRGIVPRVKRGVHRIKGKTYGAKPLVKFSSTGDFAIGRARLGADTTQ